jgi:hypothetical protein
MIISSWGDDCSCDFCVGRLSSLSEQRSITSPSGGFGRLLFALIGPDLGFAFRGGGSSSEDSSIGVVAGHMVSRW